MKGRATYEVTVRESKVERKDALEVLDVLLGKRDVQSFDVGLELLDLAPADERENVGQLLHNVCNGDCHHGKQHVAFISA